MATQPKQTPNLDKLEAVMLALGDNPDIGAQRRESDGEIFWTVTFRRNGLFFIGQGASIGEAIQRASANVPATPDIAALEAKAA